MASAAGIELAMARAGASQINGLRHQNSLRPENFPAKQYRNDVRVDCRASHKRAFGIEKHVKERVNLALSRQTAGYLGAMQLQRQDPKKLYGQHVSPYGEPMRLAAGVSLGDFDRLYAPHLLRLCGALQQSPLSRQAYPLPDGAVRFAAQGATLALQLAQASVFAPDAGAKARRDLAKQYRFAVFAAAIGSAYIRVFRNVRFLVDGVAWNPLSELSLYEFSAKTGGYDIAWAQDGDIAPHPAVDAMVFMAAFPPGFWERFDTAVLQDLAGGLSPAKNAVSETPMQRLIRATTEKAFEQESLRIAQNVGALESIPIAIATSNAASDAPNDTGAEAGKPPISAIPGSQAGKMNTPPAQQDVPTYPLPVRQFFAAMKGDDKFPEMREHIKATTESVSVPLKFLGRYGQKPTYAAQMLESAGLVITKNAEYLVLRPDVIALLGL